MKEAVIVSAVRTPQGKFGGAFKDLKAVDLGKTAIEGLFEKVEARPSASEDRKLCRPSKFRNIDNAPVEEEYHDWNDDSISLDIDEIIMGNVLQGGQGQNPARQASIMAGMPREVPAYTVNKVCASGMKAVTLAAEKIESGKADAMISGGFENMSNAPYILPDHRWGEPMALNTESKIKDMMVLDGLYETFYDCHMGITAENLAEVYEISREEQERLSVESHNRAMRAIENGLFEEEIVPVDAGRDVVKKDEAPRDTDLDSVKNLPPAFKEDGTITAATSSSIADGAAALLLTSREYAEERDLEVMGSIGDYASVGLDPQYMGLGSSVAMEKIFESTSYGSEDIDVFEENEAFAAQILACMKENGSPKYGVGMNEDGSEYINPHGSGISLGHPIGATGARILVTLTHELKRQDYSRGAASLCVGGGMGMATLIER
ncbi:MAG: thiolase family protein [Candidatus Thermoplasmatota archaeon]